MLQLQARAKPPSPAFPAHHLADRLQNATQNSWSLFQPCSPVILVVTSSFCIPFASVIKWSPRSRSSQGVCLGSAIPELQEHTCGSQSSGLGCEYQVVERWGSFFQDQSKATVRADWVNVNYELAFQSFLIWVDKSWEPPCPCSCHSHLLLEIRSRFNATYGCRSRDEGSRQWS